MQGTSVTPSLVMSDTAVGPIVPSTAATPIRAGSNLVTQSGDSSDASWPPFEASISAPVDSRANATLNMFSKSHSIVASTCVCTVK